MNYLIRRVGSHFAVKVAVESLGGLFDLDREGAEPGHASGRPAGRVGFATVASALAPTVLELPKCVAGEAETHALVLDHHILTRLLPRVVSNIGVCPVSLHQDSKKKQRK